MKKIWQALEANRKAAASRPIARLFAADADRFTSFSAQFADMCLDFSKTNIDQPTLKHLLQLATLAEVPAKRTALFSGAHVNGSEDRAALHTALRHRGKSKVLLDGHDVMPEIRATLAQMRRFADGVRGGTILAADGGQFTDLVNIGIGGSDLGPAMATRALAPYHDGPRTHFVSNVDGAHIHDTLARLVPERTLIVVASKSFATAETLMNAEVARRWLRERIGVTANTHLVGITAVAARSKAFGILPERIFSFEDWVGGRYSIWGPVGLSLMLAIGPEHFDAFLDGAAAMDAHFCEAPLAENLPVLLALTGIWHRNICNYPSRAILPYDQRLSRLPAYLQQLDMESNGKRVTTSGASLPRASAPIVWGAVGTNGQHAFMQALHQGTDVIPSEFLLAAEGHEPAQRAQHDMLVANCLAQSRALMTGCVDADAPHRAQPGNRPSVTLLYRKLTPQMLGQLIALYEHRTFVEGAIWGVNSFDQWGVELGKEIAAALLPMVRGAPAEGCDGSTAGLLAQIHALGQD